LLANESTYHESRVKFSNRESFFIARYFFSVFFTIVTPYTCTINPIANYSPS
jgi:hypothetical protein